ncbi:MAG: phosphoenolpyruvate--protein phosphotransferase [Tissierellia bacterium]|nr:phosphoenolpyruvate--protein phosphotransferase [Tissierellia bacterium]
MKAIGVSEGIAIGQVFLFKEPELNIRKTYNNNIDNEIRRFEEAVEEASGQIKKLHATTFCVIGKKEADIFIAHDLILKDPDFLSIVKKKIEDEKVNAEFAIKDTMDVFISRFEKMDNEQLKLRATDLKDISKRLLKILMGSRYDNSMKFDQYTVLIAQDLTPSETVYMNTENIVGIITEFGGKMSHTSIISRTLGIPAVVGAKGILKSANNGDRIIINGTNGEIILNPSESEIKFNKQLIDEQNHIKQEIKKLKIDKTVTGDGFRVHVSGNIGSSQEIDKILLSNGDGVGLFRTEFLCMDKDSLPTEEEQFIIYKHAAEMLKDKPLIIRTLDAGGDKEIRSLRQQKEENPAIGYRGIRICIDRVEVFKAQIRAILRASSFGNIKMMFPMISNLNQLRYCKKVVEDVKNELINESVEFNHNIEIGIMVEIPAVAINSKSFAKEVDFFSIGTNDLIQFTLAVDRCNENIAHLYNQYDPAVLKLIKFVIDNGHSEGIPVNMCGEIAGDKKLIPVLYGMGLDEFSINPGNIMETKYLISKLSKEYITERIDNLLKLDTSEEVENYIDTHIINNLF